MHAEVISDPERAIRCSKYYRVSTMGRPDFIIQGVYNEKARFWKCFKNRQMAFYFQVLRVKGLPTFLG
jgi:hypothetical protein